MFKIVFLLVGMMNFGAPAHAACTDSASRLSSEALVAFIEHPLALLDKYQQGTPLLTTAVTELASASRLTFKPLMDVARVANNSQSDSIGAGLARASRACRGKDTAMAAEIAKLASASPNRLVVHAFLDHTDEPADLMPKASDLPKTDTGYRHTFGPSLRYDRESARLSDPFSKLDLNNP